MDILQELMSAEAEMRRIGVLLLDARSERHRAFGERLVSQADRALDAIWDAAKPAAS